MTGEQQARLETLHAVIGLFNSWEDAPPLGDVIALAEWVVDGSITAAAAVEGQRHMMYRGDQS